MMIDIKHNLNVIICNLHFYLTRWLTPLMFCGYRESSVLNSAAALMKPRGFPPQRLGGVQLGGRGMAELT